MRPGRRKVRRRGSCPRSGAAWLAALALLLAGCGGGERALEEGAPPPTPAPWHRPSDDLLQRPELQHLVDLQVLRDGAGLGNALAADDPAVRARAAFALGSVQDADQVAKLVALLDDESPAVRRDAAFALGQSADSAVGPVLLDRLAREETPEVRRFLLYALGKTGGTSELAALTNVELRSGEEAQRALTMARFAIRGVFQPDAAVWLGQALHDEDPEVRRNASYFFDRARNTHAWAAVAGDVRRALDEYALDDPAAMHLLVGLGRAGDPGDNERILRWLEGAGDWRARANAAGALMGRRLDDARVRKALLGALDDPSTNVAMGAARSLTSNPSLPPETLDGIQEWVQGHPDEWQVGSLLLVPLAVDKRTDLVRGWLDAHADNDVARGRGLAALGAAPGEDVTRTLMDAVRNAPSSVGSEALRALGRRWRFFRNDTSMHRSYFDTFAAALESGDLALQYSAASLMADSVFLELGVTDVLMDAYREMALPRDVEPMTAILDALGSLGDPAAVPLLQGAVHSPELVLRTNAASSLENITGEPVAVPEVRDPPDRTVDWPSLAELGSAPRLVLETNRGRIVIRLDVEGAPLTVQTIAGFARQGRYDGVPFHRVEPNFVIQGGDFARGDGFGGPGFDIRSEFTEVPYLRGVVGMASAGKDTEGSQFFVTHSEQHHLEGAYTAFGWVVEGIDVVDRIRIGDRVLSAAVEPDSLREG